jgi:hypothetical protein
VQLADLDSDAAADDRPTLDDVVAGEYQSRRSETDFNWKDESSVDPQRAKSVAEVARLTASINSSALAAANCSGSSDSPRMASTMNSGAPLRSQRRLFAMTVHFLAELHPTSTEVLVELLTGQSAELEGETNTLRGHAND